jgi:hypothetical protein
MSARSSVERQFDALLAEIAEEVARLEGKRSRVAECQASLFHDFFTIAERLGT